MNAIYIDPAKTTLLVSHSFYNRARVYGSNEYYKLRQAMKENPGFTVEFKTTQKKTYKRLTLQKMEEYIKTQADSEKNLALFDAVQQVAKAKNSLYPLTKKWFLATYPQYKEREATQDETAELVSTAGAAKQKESTVGPLVHDHHPRSVSGQKVA